MTNELNQLKQIVADAPECTEMFGGTLNCEYVPLFQCKESQEWLYWTGYEWSPTELQVGDPLIQPKILHTIIEQAEENDKLRARAAELEKELRIKTEFMHSFVKVCQSGNVIATSKSAQKQLSDMFKKYTDDIEAFELLKEQS